MTCRDAAEEIIAARDRGVPAYGETCIQYLVPHDRRPARPGFEGARYVCSPPLRDAPTRRSSGTRCAYDHLQSISTDHCPFNDEQKRLGLDDFSKIPNGLAGDPAPPADAVGARRAHGPAVDEPRSSRSPRRRRRGSSACTRKGTIAPGFDADVVIFDPTRASTFGADTSFMNVDYDLVRGPGAAARRARCAPTFAAGRSSTTRQIRHAAGSRPLRRAGDDRGPRRHRMTVALAIDVDQVLADLDELATASGGRHAGAKRLAWSQDWRDARAWLRGKLDEVPGVTVHRDARRATCVTAR